MVFQSYSLYPWLSVRRNIEFGPEIKKVPAAERRKTSSELIHLMKLDGSADADPKVLSGGMKQRAAIARALAGDPEVLLMDEPFGALDAQTRQIMQELLTDIWQRYRKTVLFVTHDIEEAIFLGDVIYVMTSRPGRIRTTLAVDIPRPRTFDTLTGPRFAELRNQVVGVIHEESLKAVESIVDAGVIPLALGGDHSITLGELRAIFTRHGPVGLIDFDSHTDTWDNYWGERYTHGTWCRRAIEEGLIDTARAVQIGIRGSLYGREDRDGARALGLHLIPTETLLARGVADVLPEVVERAGKGPVFLTFDIDFVDPGFAPGTGTPEVGGPSSRDALRLVRGLRGLDLVGFDMVEVQPQYDHGEVTSLLAGTLLHEFLTLVALNRGTL